MKVLHVPFGYYPDPVGGTEVYVGALAQWQARDGIAAAIAAPAAENRTYRHEGLPVYRFRTGKSVDLRDLYGDGDREAAEAFNEILQSASPDVVHVHAFTSGVSLRLVEKARRRSLPVVFTYHTPTVSCDRGSLQLWGTETCDGVMSVGRCAACTVQGKGISKPAGWIAGSLPPSVGEKLGRMGLSGGAWTALRMSELTELRHAAVRALFRESVEIVAVCEWVRDLLLRNGVPPEKITLCRQGLAYPMLAVKALRPRGAGSPVRLVFLGRLDPAKGLGVLSEALRMAPGMQVTLDIFTVVQDAAMQTESRLLSALRADSRIRVLPALAPADVVARLAEYDAVVVPSQGLETGPLVVYEAFGAAVPVVGSNLGGIAELVEHEKNGLLVEASSRQAWTGAIRRLVEDRMLLPKLRQGIGPARTMREVAADMRPVYERAIQSRAIQSQGAASVAGKR
jgi:glycosyltransferase involved in cell wall biosynthesis